MKLLPLYGAKCQRLWVKEHKFRIQMIISFLQYTAGPSCPVDRAPIWSLCSQQVVCMHLRLRLVEFTMSPFYNILVYTEAHFSKTHCSLPCPDTLWVHLIFYRLFKKTLFSRCHSNLTLVGPVFFQQLLSPNMDCLTWPNCPRSTWPYWTFGSYPGAVKNFNREVKSLAKGNTARNYQR